jgi:DNA-binding CsgD family transcriptional regulator
MEGEMRLPFEKMSTRTVVALTSAGVQTYQQLTDMTPAEIRKIRNLGRRSLAEIEKILSDEDLNLREKPKRVVVLTPGEKEVLWLRSQGMSYQKVAMAMNLSATRIVQLEKNAIAKKGVIGELRQAVL